MGKPICMSEVSIFYLGEDGELWEEIDSGCECYNDWSQRSWIVLQNFHDPEQIEHWWTDQDGFTAMRRLTDVEVIARAAE